MTCKKDVAVVRTIGIDTGKNTLHMIGLNEKGAIVLREKLSRGRIAARLVNIPPCLIGIEAGMATHYMSRDLLALGHEVKQVPPAYAKPFRQGHKNDFRDFLSAGYLMDRLSAPSKCRAQALHCRMVADTVMDEQVRALWVSMAQTWTKLAQSEVPPLLAYVRYQRPDNICSLRDLPVLTPMSDNGPPACREQPPDSERFR